MKHNNSLFICQGGVVLILNIIFVKHQDISIPISEIRMSESAATENVGGEVEKKEEEAERIHFQKVNTQNED